MQLPIWNTNTYNGVTNARQEGIFGAMAQPVPIFFHTFLNDFDTFAAGDWTITETDAGATEALAAGDGGWLLITNTAADDDLVSMQSVAANFLMESGKRGFFEARFKVSDATQSDLIIGLEATTATPFTVVNGILFQKADGSTSLSFQTTKASTTTTASAVATVVADTFLTVSFYYDGVSAIYYAINGVIGGSIATTNLPIVNLAPTISLRNGEAVAKTMTIDYIAAWKERTAFPRQ